MCGTLPIPDWLPLAYAAVAVIAISYLVWFAWWRHRQKTVGPGGPRWFRRIDAVVIAAAWTMTVLLLAMWFTGSLLSWVPCAYSPFEMLKLWEPSSKQYEGVHVSAQGSGWVRYGDRLPRKMPMQKAKVSLVGDTMPSIEVSLLELTFSYVDAAGRQVPPPGPLNEAIVLSWMQTAKSGAEKEKLHVEAAELLVVIKAAAHGAMDTVPCPSFAYKEHYQGPTRVAAPPWSLALAVVFWAAIWFGGLRLLLSPDQTVAAKPQICSPG